MTKKKTAEWTKKGIILNLIALILPLTTLFVVLMLLGFYAFWALKGDGTVINYAGQVRYRSYELALLVNGYPTIQEGARDQARWTILELVSEFENILYGLRDGNKNLGLKGCKAPKKGSVFSYNDPWWQYDRHVKEYNERIKPLITHILETSSQAEAEAALKIYNKTVPPFVTDVSRTVNLLSSLSEKKVLRYKNVEFVLLGLFIGALGVSFFLAQSFNAMTRTLRNNVVEIQTSRNLLNEVLGSIGCFVRIVNPKTHQVIFQNRPLEAAYPQGLERPCYTLLGREKECEHCTSTEAVEKREDFCKEEEAANGGVFYEIHSFPFSNSDGSITTAIEVIRDITARKKMEGELEESRMRLLESQKMATVGNLTIGIAHHINNPLSGINMSADILLKEIDGAKECVHSEDLINHLRRIKEAGGRCEVVMKDLLNISRLPKLKKLPVHVNEAVEHALNVMAPQLELSKIKLVKELSDTAPNILGSHSQLEAVFMNIISGAVNEMPEGGTLTVRTEYLSSEDKVEVTIADTGCGINKNDLPSLFDPYFILKIRPSIKGTGLELSLAQLTVQSHGGTIEADSEEGNGTTFRVKLPARKETSPAGVGSRGWAVSSRGV